MSRPSTLIIDLGDFPSLTALAVQPDPEPFVLWHPAYGGAVWKRRREIVKRHAEVFSAGDLVFGSTSPRSELDESQTWWIQSMMLLDALGAADRLGCTRVLWPHQVGDNFERLSPIVDRATLLSGLLPSKTGNEAAIIDLPLLDLTETQLIEVADDSGADLSLFWPCDVTDEHPCGDCRGCQTWRKAFQTVGQPWPWARETAEAGASVA